MTRKEKIETLAQMYETSPQGIRIMVQRGFIQGAYAVMNKRRFTYQFSPQLTKELEESK